MILRVLCARPGLRLLSLRALSVELRPPSPSSPQETTARPAIPNTAEDEERLKAQCWAVARQYSSLDELKQRSPETYSVMVRRNWIREMTAHLLRTIKPRGHWDIENCRKEASKFSSRMEFRMLSGGAYRAALRNGWLDQICGRMELVKKPNRYWNDKETCRLEALKYSSKTDFIKHSKSAYSGARRNHWLEEICSHMAMLRSPSRHWHRKEVCAEEALKYKSRTEFELGSSSAYAVANKLGWLNDICKHMRPSHMLVPRGHWNVKSNCMEEASKYSSAKQFYKHSGSAFQGCYRNGWLDEACAHMRKATTKTKRKESHAKKESTPIVPSKTKS